MANGKKEWTMQEIAFQLRIPEGEDGLVIASKMQKTNSNLYKMALSFFPGKTDLKLLEIGFGNGEHFSNFLQLFPGITIYGADISTTMCELVHRSYANQIKNQQIQLFCGDAKETPYNNNFFDVILSINTLYFWQPVQNYFNEIFRILKPGGRFILGFRPKKTMDQLSFTQYGFILYDINEVKQLLIDTGFSVIEEQQETYKRESVNADWVDNTDVVLNAIK